MDKNYLRNYYNIENQYIILWTTQCHGLTMEENLINMRCIFNTLEKIDNVTLIIKQHPNEPKKFSKLLKRYIHRYNNHNIVLFPKDCDTFILLNICDLLITKNSTTALEVQFLINLYPIKFSKHHNSRWYQCFVYRERL